MTTHNKTYVYVQDAITIAICLLTLATAGLGGMPWAMALLVVLAMASTCGLRRYIVRHDERREREDTIARRLSDISGKVIL